MTVINVNSTSSLVKALASAHSGDWIALASGDYSSVTISKMNFTGAGVTIISQDPTHPAVLHGLNVLSSSGLNFRGLAVSTEGLNQSGGMLLQSDSNITFNGLNLHGSLDNNPANDVSGMNISYSQNVTITNSTFHDLANAISHLDDNGLTIENSKFSYIRSDGIDGGGSSNVQISTNSFTDFFPASNPEHPGRHPVLDPGREIGGSQCDDPEQLDIDR